MALVELPKTSGPTPLTRREFLGTTACALAAATFPSIIPSSALGKDGAVAPSNRVTVGVIGCGPQGRGDMINFLGEADCHVVAVCDLKTDQLGLARRAVNDFYGNEDCRTYHDFRELLARKDIDACLIATPDHWHVLAALAAVNSGKDVYLEKPLGLTLEEGQALRATVHRKRRIFQFGTQQRSSKNFRLAAELVRNGSASFTTSTSGPRAARRAAPASRWRRHPSWITTGGSAPRHSPRTP